MMNKNKKEYIDAINEIKVGDNLKKETLNKIKEKRSYKNVYLLASLVIVFVIVMSIAIPMRKEEVNRNSEIIVAKADLPKVESFEKLYSILKENYKDVARGTNEPLFTDSAMIQEPVTMSDMAKSSVAAEDVSENSNSDYSKTNVQVEGVDEADIVKTDGDYIYYVGSNKITIIDARNSSNLQIAEEIIYKNANEQKYFYPREIFINNNKLIVIGNKTVYENTENRMNMSYYYDSNKQYTVAITYDISKKDDIKQMREVEIEGNYLSSRMIGDNIYLVANKNLYPYSILRYDIEKLNKEDFKIQYTDTAISNNIQSIDFTDVYYFPESEDTSYLNILGFNVNNNEPAHIGTYLGAGNEIYSSQDNLYVTRVKYEYNYNSWAGYSNYDVNTNIYKFKLKDSDIKYTSSGSVPGEVLNQFSMDEADGYFRIATTDSESWDNETDDNNLYVLNENLEIVGKIEGLAKGERIYSVRFMGNRAYMVTFVETDPLFVIDLSEPTNPTVLGELKIPGYSKYLHPYDENHLIGFGEDTKTVNYGYGNVVTTNGMKMALFDVTNPTNPAEMYSVKIGDKGTYSELLNNHKALLFSKEKNIIAFPITISKDVNNYRSNLRFQGAIVYGLDLENGFTLKGQIAHMQVDNGYRNYNYLKEVERIIYIKDDLFTLSKGLMRATNMNTMEIISEVEIEVEEEKYAIPLYD